MITLYLCCVYAALMNHNGAPSQTETGGMHTRSTPVNGSIHSSHSQSGILEDKKSGSSANDAWRRWSLDKSGFSDFQRYMINLIFSYCASYLYIVTC